MVCCFRRNLNVPAYRKQEQLNSNLPSDWLIGRTLVRTVALVSVSTRDRVKLRPVVSLQSVLKSTNTLPLLRATWREGQSWSPAIATGEIKRRERMGRKREKKEERGRQEKQGETEMRERRIKEVEDRQRG